MAGAQPRVSECTEAAQTVQDVLHTALNIQYGQRSKVRSMYMKLHDANAGYQLGASLASPAGWPPGENLSSPRGAVVA